MPLSGTAVSALQPPSTAAIIALQARKGFSNGHLDLVAIVIAIGACTEPVSCPNLTHNCAWAVEPVGALIENGNQLPLSSLGVSASKTSASGMREGRSGITEC